MFKGAVRTAVFSSLVVAGSFVTLNSFHGNASNHGENFLSSFKKKTYALSVSAEDALTSLANIRLVKNERASPSKETVLFDINAKTKALSANAKGLNPKAIKLALKAYQKAQQKGLVKQKDIITIVDFSKVSTKDRLYVFDLKTNKVLFHELVMHGKKSGNKIPTSFSNKPESKKSSIGAFLTKNTYKGKFGYALRIQGLEKGINHNVASRSIVVHASKFVSHKLAQAHHRLARSLGCFAVSPKISTPLINTIKNGSLIFAYAPDEHYLSSSTFI